MKKAIDYLIIGNGIAGMSAAEEIRKNDKQGKIVIVSKEKYITYNRTKLSHYICQNFKDKEIFIHDDKWYKERNIQLILNTKVSFIDVKNNKVIDSDGTELLYKKLLISVGSNSRLLPIHGINKDGIYTLRSYDDLQRILSGLSKCESVAVIGGGLLGVEAALSLKQLDKKVELIHHSPWLLSRQLDREMGEKVGEKIRNKGINIHLSEDVEEVIGEVKVEGLRTQSGNIIKAEAVIVSVGVQPELKLIENTGNYMG